MKKINYGYNFSIPRGIVEFVVTVHMVHFKDFAWFKLFAVHALSAFSVVNSNKNGAPVPRLAQKLLVFCLLRGQISTHKAWCDIFRKKSASFNSQFEQQYLV